MPPQSTLSLFIAPQLTYQPCRPKPISKSLTRNTSKSGRSHVRPTDHPSNRESVRPTVRPVLLSRTTTSVVLSATTSTLFIATTKETTKEVVRPKAAPPLLWWRPTAASFVVAMNRVDVVALNTIFVVRLSKTGRTVGRTDSRLDGWSVGRTDMRAAGLARISSQKFGNS